MSPQRLYQRRCPGLDNFHFPSLHELMVLRILSEGPMYPVQIVERSNGTLTTGTVYGMLKRLLRDGHVILASAPTEMLNGHKRPRCPHTLSSTGRFLVAADRVLSVMLSTAGRSSNG